MFVIFSSLLIYPTANCHLCKEFLIAGPENGPEWLNEWTVERTMESLKCPGTFFHIAIPVHGSDVRLPPRDLFNRPILYVATPSLVRDKDAWPLQQIWECIPLG